MTKVLEQFKMQLKTHVLSFLTSNPDKINNYGIYLYPNNFSEKDAKNFIFACQKFVKEHKVKIYCNNLIDITNRDYQRVLNNYMNTQKKKVVGMDPNMRIQKFCRFWIFL